MRLCLCFARLVENVLDVEAVRYELEPLSVLLEQDAVSSCAMSCRDVWLEIKNRDGHIENGTS